MPEEAPSYLVGSVDRALQLIELLRDRGSLSLTAVSEELGVAPSTAHRLLGTLAHRGYVRQDPESRAYRSGRALLQLALGATAGLDVRGAARPELEGLAATVGETVHLARLEGDHVVFLDSVESTRAVRVTSRVGTALPAHCTASGKVLLAGMGVEEVRALLPDPLPQVTPRTRTSRDALERELVRIRRNGFATNFGESEPDLSAVAVAIEGERLDRLSVTISTPRVRLEPDVVRAQASAARETRARIADRLTPGADPA